MWNKSYFSDVTRQPSAGPLEIPAHITRRHASQYDETLVEASDWVIRESITSLYQDVL